MAQITAAMVKELRETTGAGMMDCKKALSATDGDKEKAIDWLREKGISKAEKKAGRVAAEGAVFACVDGSVGVILELNCETDFAAGNEQFRTLGDKILAHIAKTNPTDLDALLSSDLGGKKILLRRFVRYESAGRIGSYIHMGGKIGVLVDLSGGDEALAKNVAMHIAASNPQAIDRAGVDASAIEHEKEVLRKQALEEGKPEKIVDKMVEGRINKFYKEVCLVEQEFVKDPDKKISDVLGGNAVKAFTRYQLGEGIEKKQEDFAAEVQAQLK